MRPSFIWVLLTSLLFSCANIFAEEAADPKSNPTQSISLPAIYPTNTMPGLVAHRFGIPINAGCNEASLLSSEYYKWWEQQHKIIYEAWRTAPSYQDKKPILKLHILSSGKLETMEILISSGDFQIDQASMDAVSRVFPLQSEVGPNVSHRSSIQILSFLDMQNIVASAPDPRERKWVDSVSSLVQGNWKKPSLQFKKTVVVLFIYAKTNQILAQDIAATSCNPQRIGSCLQATISSSTLF